MPVPPPAPGEALSRPPDLPEVRLISRGIATAVTGPGGLTATQRALIAALTEAMTGFTADLQAPPITPAEFAVGLATRNLDFRSRIVQNMVLAALVLRPLPEEVAAQVAEFAVELCVDDDMLPIAQSFSAGTLGLAAFDFERAGYAAEWQPADAAVLHTARALDSPWEFDVRDEALAHRWAELEHLPPGSLGRRVTEMYRARGFAYPGLPGSAPPLLCQHDWVHVLADYGTTVESELEVFAFIARANDDMHAFSLLAMVVSLFETGYLSRGAGLFESSTGHLSEQGVSTRVADAMRRGALCRGSTDFLRLDWFDVAEMAVSEAQSHFGVVPKSTAAQQAGSVSPWQPGGISPFQMGAGTALARAQGREYESFGAV